MPEERNVRPCEELALPQPTKFGFRSQEDEQTSCTTSRLTLVLSMRERARLGLMRFIRLRVKICQLLRNTTFRGHNSTIRSYGSREGHRLEFGVWRLEFGAWSLELGVWSLEFGAWSLALGVWSLDGVCHAMGEGRWAGSMGRIAHGAFDRVKRSTYFQARL